MPRKKRRVKTLLRRVTIGIALKGIDLAQLIGLVLVIVLVFGGLVLTGGRAAMHALPFELALIGGAAIGTVLIGNSLSVAREALGGFVKAFKGAMWGRDDYQELLVLLGTLMRKARQGGFVAIESDIEHPETSAAFQAAPHILADPAASGMICDAFRLMALDLSDPARAEARMDQSIAVYLDQRMKAVAALHTLADALPALGIVAAVLGIIRTMGSINQSPAVLGAMIGSALLGTFLGVFLAYGLVGPVAARFGQIVEEDARLLDVIRSVLGAYAEGLQPGIALEMGRSTIPLALQPDSSTLERALSASRFVAKSRTAA
jgi:chemotaxis protein MotA